MEILFIFGYIFILIASLLIIYKNTQSCYNKNDTFVNLDELHKSSLTSCCKNNKCYDKPGFLQNSQCQESNKAHRKELGESYKLVYTNEEYNNKLKNLGIKTFADDDDIATIERQSKIGISERINIDKNLGIDTLNKVLTDNQYSIPGKYDII